MKKKLILIIAILVIIVSICSMLVGCTPKTPGDFIEKWLESDTKSISIEMNYGITEYSVSKNIMYNKNIDLNSISHQYIKFEKDIFLLYHGYESASETDWGWFDGTIEYFIFENGLEFTKENCTATNVLSARIEEWHRFSLFPEVFDNYFSTINKKLVGKSGTIFVNAILTIKGNTMTIDFGKDSNYKTIVFTIGGKKIEIPKEALDSEYEHL